MPCQPNSRTCPTTCDVAFSNVYVYPLVDGSTRVTWSLIPSFQKVGPYTFTLQYSHYGVDDDAAWTDITEPEADVYEAYDTDKRSYGNYQRVHYRVLLTDGNAVIYASRPQLANSVFDFRQQQLLKQVLRSEALRTAASPNSASGYLLKRKLSGERCTTCQDFQTGMCVNGDCSTCYGTGFVGGYWVSGTCSVVDFLNPVQNRSKLGQVGTEENDVRPARMLNIPQIFSNDVWIQTGNDHRYYIASFASEIEIAGVPIVMSPVELRLAPFTDVIYRFTL